MDESSLRALISSLNSQQDSFDRWLNACSALVVIGVVAEIVFVIWEYWEDRHDWQRGIGFVRPPKPPNFLKLVLELVGVLLVSGGVGGEFLVDVKAGALETRLRKANSDLVLLLGEEVRDASASAAQAKIDAAAVGQKARDISSRIDATSHLMDLLDERVEAMAPRWMLLDSGKKQFIDALNSFPGQEIVLISCVNRTPEAAKTEDRLASLLGGPGQAGWKVRGATWSRCGPEFPSNDIGLGTAILTSNAADKTVEGAAKALFETLYGLKISSTHRIVDARSGIEIGFLLNPIEFGPDSPWMRAAKNPTEVILVIGEDPMFGRGDLAKLHSSKAKK
jgi:hypothetical protein